MLTLTVNNTAPIGQTDLVITATSGSLTHTLNLNLNVPLPIPGATAFGLSSFYNRAGIYSDGRAFSGGLDGGGYAYSANLLGSSLYWDGAAFNLGPANAPDAISCSGQTIPLPVGQLFRLVDAGDLGAMAAKASQTFTVTYTDNSTASFTQSVSDWANPQNYSGESIAASMAYRDNGGGSVEDTGTAVKVYGYIFPLNPAKTASRITLPNDGNVIVLAFTLANEPFPASLASYYNRAGIYTDGTIFSSTGGLDGGGAAYSATLLGSSVIWSNTVFDFGPANQTNVIAAAAQTLTLPAGKDSVLRMLATAEDGNQTSQPFVVTYSDGTTTTFTQSLSDWYAPQNYSGESEAVPMPYRNTSGGTMDNRVFYLYGYSFSLNSAKTVQSLRLPNNGNVVVLAVSLVPNWPPVFVYNPIAEPGITAGQACSGSIAGTAVDLNGNPLTFAKVSGPSWLRSRPAALCPAHRFQLTWAPTASW